MPSFLSGGPIILEDTGFYNHAVRDNNYLQANDVAFPRDTGSSEDVASINADNIRYGQGLGYGPLDYELNRVNPVPFNDTINLPGHNRKRFDPAIVNGEGSIDYSRASNASYIDWRSGKIVYSGTNKLLYSREWSNAAWVLGGTATKPANEGGLRCDFAAANDQLQQSVAFAVLANESIAGGVVLVGDGTIHLRIGDPTHADSSEIQITLQSDVPTFWSLNHVFAGAYANIAFTIVLKAGDTATYAAMVPFNNWDTHCQLNEGPKLCDPILNEATELAATPRVENYGRDYWRMGIKGEHSGTNEWDHSEELDNAAYTKNNCTVTADQEWSPEHHTTQSMDEIVEASDAGQIHEITRTLTVTAGTFGAFSAHVKENTRRYCRLEMFNATDGIVGYAEFDLQTQTLLASGGLALLNAGVEWVFPDDTDPLNKTDTCRIFVGAGFITGTETVFTCKLILQDTAGNSTYNGDGASSIYAWGIQAENKKYPSSYIATDQAPYTRAVDVFDYTPAGGDYPDPDANDYSVLLTAALNHVRADGLAAQNGWRFYNLTRPRLVLAGGGGSAPFVQHDASGNATFNEVAVPHISKNYLAIKDGSTLQAWLYGNQQNTDTATAVSGTLSTLRLGYFGTFGADCWFSDFRYIDKALNDAEDARGLMTAEAATYNQVLPLGDSGAGHYGNTFANLWYNAYHVIPNPLDVGNLVSGAEREVEVWNAYFTSKLLSAINASNNDGIILSDGIPALDSFGPLESTTYTFTIDQDGPASIDANYEFVLPDSSPILNIIGNRTISFDFQYDRGVTETLEWRTDVIQTIEGEQARKLRFAPRQGIKATYVLLLDEQSLADSRIYGWSDKVFNVPLLWEAQVVGEHLSGVTTINCNPETGRFIVGGTALLYIDRDTREDIEIDAIDTVAGTLTIKNPLTNSFTGGNILLMPTRSAYMAGKPTKSRQDGDYARYSINWRVTENYPPDAFTGGPIYDGFDVLEEVLISNQAIAEATYKPVEWIDNNVGIFKPYPLKTYPQENRKISWHIDGLPELMDFYRWLGNRSGRFQPFWYPTFRNDFTVLGSIGAGDLVIPLVDNQYTMYESGATRHVFMWLQDGTKLYRQVDDLEDDQIHILTSFGIDIDPEDILFFGWLHLLRLNADRIRLKHDGQWSTTSIPLITNI